MCEGKDGSQRSRSVGISHALAEIFSVLHEHFLPGDLVKSHIMKFIEFQVRTGIGPLSESPKRVP